MISNAFYSKMYGFKSAIVTFANDELVVFNVEFVTLV
jgi:hypothetical protein